MLGGAGAVGTESVYLELRRSRSRNRKLGLLDVAAGGVGSVIVCALAVSAVAEAAPAGSAPTPTSAPILVGAATALMLVSAMASGARGGPLALESAFVHLVLLAPVDRTAVLRRPAVRQLALAVALGGLSAGAVGLAVAPLVGGLRLLNWLVAGSLAGALALATSLALASLRTSGRAALLAQVVIASWWVADVLAGTTTSPAAALAGIPFRPLTIGTVAWPVVVSTASVAFGIARVDRLSVEPAWRRRRSADQLRVALGLNDLRTALLLLRRRAREQPRTRPWMVLSPRPGSGPIIRRGLHSILRWPARRIVRFWAMAATTGAALQVAASAPIAWAVVVVLLYAAALDAIDPLAEELDHPDLLRRHPVTTGTFLLRHLVLPALLLVGFGSIAATVVVSIAPERPVAALAAALVVPVALASLAGAALTASRVARPLTTVLDVGLPVEVVAPRVILRVVAPLLPILATIAPPVMALVDGAPVGRALLSGTAGSVWSMLMLVWATHRGPLQVAAGRITLAWFTRAGGRPPAAR